MPAYLKKDFDRIAAAIGKNAADVIRYEKYFEAAALWYRLRCNASNEKRITPSVMGNRMRSIASTARRLLNYLLYAPGEVGIFDPSQAPDGPAIAILEVLASADDGTEDAVIRATTRIGRLIDILEAVDAARELERLAENGAKDVSQMAKLIGQKGHRGQAAVNDWIADMMSLYKKITGRDPGTSFVPSGRKNAGKASGPLIRFLTAAGRPLGTKLSANSWRSRIWDIRTGGDRRK